MVFEHNFYLFLVLLGMNSTAYVLYCIGASFCAAVDAGGDDLLVMTDNGTHPVQIHTLPSSPLPGTLSYAF